MPRTRQPVPAVIVAGFLLVTAALLAVSPNTLRLGFPALATLAAAALFLRSRTTYIQFVLWLWFLSPLLRRLVDFRTEFIPTSPLLLAPFFATAVSGIVLLRNPRLLARPAAAPFALAFAGVFFGTVYGLTRYAPADVARGLVNWLCPILFGFFLYAERSRFAEYRAAITRTLILGTLSMSVYGIVQFFLLPDWDESWMRGLNNGAFGEPVARELRVFSTMNAPATLATYLMAGLLLAFTLLLGRSRRTLATLAALTGVLALILTTSRSLWIGLVFGVLWLALELPGRAKLRLAAAFLLTLVLAAGASLLPGIHPVVVARVSSFSAGASDVSYAARVYGHGVALAHLASEPLGEGMGSTDADHATDGSDDRLGPHDSTLLELLYALGGPGTLIYGIAMLFAAVRIRRSRHAEGPPSEPFAIALRAILVALVAQCLLTSIVIGVPGFLLWLCLGMSLAASDLRHPTSHRASHRALQTAHPAALRSAFPAPAAPHP